MAVDFVTLIDAAKWEREASVPLIANAWYPVAWSDALRNKPVAARLYGLSFALFRSKDGAAHALLDRCAHRNVPLSLGKVCGDALECGYHGWRFDGAGQCIAVPGWDVPPEALDKQKRRVWAPRCAEQSGLVWIWPGELTPPAPPPTWKSDAFAPQTYLREQRCIEAPAHLIAVAENALDVPHTAFLHRGWFRKPSTNKRPVTVEFIQTARAVEAHYRGEASPPGLIGLILAPKGGEVEHVDRFFWPGRLEVEYRLGRLHVLAEAHLSPAMPHQTRLFACVSVTMPAALRPLLRPLLRGVALRIVAQDNAMLRQQSTAAQTFGGAHYASSPIDIMAGPIRQILSAAPRSFAPYREGAGGDTSSSELTPAREETHAGERRRSLTLLL